MIACCHLRVMPGIPSNTPYDLCVMPYINAHTTRSMICVPCPKCPCNQPEFASCVPCESFILESAGLAAWEEQRVGRCLGGHRSSAGGRRAAEALASRIAVSGGKHRFEAMALGTPCGATPWTMNPCVGTTVSWLLEVATLSLTSELREDGSARGATLRMRRVMTFYCSRLAGPRGQQSVGRPVCATKGAGQSVSRN
jgi:hypothetical protein